MTMTITSELRGHSHRHKISQALSLVSRMVRWENFTNACTLTARVEVATDVELRNLLLDCSDCWEFDPGPGLLTRKNAYEGDRVRMEIDVRQLMVDDVYRIVADTDPGW